MPSSSYQSTTPFASNAGRSASGKSAHPVSPFDAWKDGIDKADADWDAYDCELRRAVAEYNRHLGATPGFFPMDWQLAKAMLWVESGARSKAWRSAPLQIGNPGDPGLAALLGNREGGELIVPPSMRAGISLWSVRADPVSNIHAGIGYLLMRLTRFGMRSVPDAKSGIYEVRVKAADTLEKIARSESSTVAHLKRLNPEAHLLRPGQVLKCQRASMQRAIIGWLPLNTSTAATYYNGGGDSRYARKLDYTLAAIRRREAVSCR